LPTNFHLQLPRATVNTSTMAPTTNADGYGSNNTRPGASNDHIAHYWRKYEHCKFGDEMKNALLEVSRSPP
jgi:hypothetical protein